MRSPGGAVQAAIGVGEERDMERVGADPLPMEVMGGSIDGGILDRDRERTHSPQPSEFTPAGTPPLYEKEAPLTEADSLFPEITPVSDEAQRRTHISTPAAAAARGMLSA